MATRTRPGRPTARHARGARRRRRGPPRQRSDLSARVLAALPAIAVAIVLVVAGGAVFALGLFVLGCICMHELYAMYDRTHPVRLAGFVSLAGLLAAALYGGPPQVLLAAVCALPVLFAFTLMQRRPSVAGLAVTLLGIYWIGLAFAHAVMLRELDHGAGIVVDVLVGTFLGDTGAYVGGRMFGRRPLAPAISPGKTVEGLVTGMICAVLGVWSGSPAATRNGFLPPTRGYSVSASPWWRRWATCSSHSSSAMLRPRTPADSSAPTAARSTASTPCSSRPSSATTSGRRTCEEGRIWH